MKRLFLYFTLSLFCFSCSTILKRNNKIKKSEASLIPDAPGAKEKINIISKKKYFERISATANNYIRMVPVLMRDPRHAGHDYYRFFDIQEDSIYSLIGLKNNDIVVSANNYVVPGQRVFWEYIKYLPKVTDPKIEIIRNSEPLILKYMLID